MNMASKCESQDLDLPIILPPLNNDIVFTDKEGLNIYKNAKTTLFKVKSLAKKRDSSLSKETTYHSPISSKLTELYLKSAQDNREKDGYFVTHDYLEELVMQQNLNYFIMKLYPSKKYSLYIKNEERIQFLTTNDYKNKDFVNSIDKEEIPFELVELIMEYPWNLLYDYHCFLQIQKFAFEDLFVDADPIFSTFILLKPTNSLMYCLLVNECGENQMSVEECSNLEERAAVFQQESEMLQQDKKMLLENSGPLYLGVDSTAVEVANFLKFYRGAFKSTSLKSLIAKKALCRPRGAKRIQELESWLSGILPKKKKKRRSKKKTHFNKCLQKVFKFHKPSSVYFSFVDLKKNLGASLIKRSLGFDEREYSANTLLLVEVFYFLTNKLVNTHTHNDEFQVDKYKLPVYFENGAFYCCLTNTQYLAFRQNCMPSHLVGGRKELDRYILKIAEILSERFSETLLIFHKNVIENKNILFFPRRNVKDERHAQRERDEKERERDEKERERRHEESELNKNGGAFTSPMEEEEEDDESCSELNKNDIGEKRNKKKRAVCVRERERESMPMDVVNHSGEKERILDINVYKLIDEISQGKTLKQKSVVSHVNINDTERKGKEDMCVEENMSTKNKTFSEFKGRKRRKESEFKGRKSQVGRKSKIRRKSKVGRKSKERKSKEGRKSNERKSKVRKADRSNDMEINDIEVKKKKTEVRDLTKEIVSELGKDFAYMEEENVCHEEDYSQREKQILHVLAQDSLTEMERDEIFDYTAVNNETCAEEASKVKTPVAYYFSEAFSFKGDSVTSLFEASPFEIEERNVNSYYIDGSLDKSIEIYHSLKSEFIVTDDDFTDDLFHIHDDDTMMKLQSIRKRIMEGDE